MSDAISEFREAMASAGLCYTGAIDGDGRLHRFKAEGDGDANSWFVLFLDGLPAGKFGCWKRGLSETWHQRNGQRPSREDYAGWKKKWAQAEVARKIEQERDEGEARIKAKDLVERGERTEHPYLLDKRVKLHGDAVVTGDFLVLPLCDEQGRMQSAQKIDVEGGKRYLRGGRKNGCWFSLSSRTDGPLIICEGYATGASLHEATGYAVVCAMDCHNLKPCVLALRKLFPDRVLVVAADNDHRTEGNPGLTEGRVAAESARAILVSPVFPDLYEGDGTDFNDLVQVSGLRVVRDQLMKPLSGGLPLIVDVFEFVAQPIPMPSMLVEGLLHQGTKMVLGGGSKAFKTWMQMDLAISVCSGLPWMGFETRCGRVLYVNFEIQERFFQDRIKVMTSARSLELEPNRLDVWNLRGFSAPYPLIIPKIVDRISSEGYSLVILDPIYKLYGKTDENSASEVAQLLNMLEAICVETRAAIAFGAHYSKGNQAAKDSIDRISGSGVFARDPDSILTFTRHEEEDAFVCDPILRNLSPLDPFVVRWKYPLMLRDDNLDPTKLKQPGGRPTNYSESDLLSLLPEPGLSTEEWMKKAAEIHGISRASFFRLKSQISKNDDALLSKIDNKWKPVKHKTLTH